MTELQFGDSNVHRRKNVADHTNGLRVIGAGLPRTGTSSLKNALEILGFGPCHHMTELLKNPEQIDVPTALFYEKLHHLYPQAKLILTVRDSNEQWFECFNNSIAPLWLDNFFFITVYRLRNLRWLSIVARKIAKKWITEYGSIGPHIHELHNAQVIQENKSEDLLVFNVKEGWLPQCRFLNVPIPQDIPFPNGNGPEYVQGKLQRARIIGCCTWTLIAAGLAILIYFLPSLVGY
ncbi:unnamed protein product [Rotaria sp. Silwood2]|nr:unnamed protein product [Rotaria sp. Silwood2]CAF2693363.1 unnamed protein product [Rotaria sp. Silwood2]CAF3088258.1 unnamed protein product [Rotaria sp. Silwood2]